MSSKRGRGRTPSISSLTSISSTNSTSNPNSISNSSKTKKNSCCGSILWIFLSLALCFGLLGFIFYQALPWPKNSEISLLPGAESLETFSGLFLQSYSISGNGDVYVYLFTSKPILNYFREMDTYLAFPIYLQYSVLRYYLHYGSHVNIHWDDSGCAIDFYVFSNEQQFREWMDGKTSDFYFEDTMSVSGSTLIDIQETSTYYFVLRNSDKDCNLLPTNATFMIQMNSFDISLAKENFTLTNFERALNGSNNYIVFQAITLNPNGEVSTLSLQTYGIWYSYTITISIAVFVVILFIYSITWFIKKHSQINENVIQTRSQPINQSGRPKRRHSHHHHHVISEGGPHERRRSSLRYSVSFLDHEDKEEEGEGVEENKIIEEENEKDLEIHINIEDKKQDSESENESDDENEDESEDEDETSNLIKNVDQA